MKRDKEVDTDKMKIKIIRDKLTRLEENIQ